MCIRDRLADRPGASAGGRHAGRLSDRRRVVGVGRRGRRGAGRGDRAGLREDGGELPDELAAVLAQTRAGTPLMAALASLRDRAGVEALARFVDGMVVAIERGTPLAEVLRAQAVDVREAGKRALLEAGGRREIAMMFPVVFLVLPVTVVFALYPGLFSLVTLAR